MASNEKSIPTFCINYFSMFIDIFRRFRWYVTTKGVLDSVTFELYIVNYFWLAVHGKPVLFWKGNSGLKFPCFLVIHANGTGPFEFRAVPIL